MRLFAACLALAATPAMAAAQPADKGYNPLYDGAPEWTVGEDITFKLRGRAYYDYANIDNDFASPVPGVTDTETRTLRLGAEVDAGAVKMKAEFDFIDDKVQPKDVLVQFKPGDRVTIQAGHYKEHASLDEQTSSRFTTFMERGSLTDAFSIDRRIGVSVLTGGDNWTWSTGLHGGVMDEFDLDDTWSVSSRATFAPVADKEAQTFVHLGAFGRYRSDSSINGDSLRYRQRPLAHLADRYVATPRFADTDFLTGVEAAAVRGPLHVQAEAARQSADGAAADADFNSAYIQAGWFLTGESRAYKPGKGAFDRTKPLRAIGRGGFGAVELAARFDTVDLTDGPVTGGQQDSLTLGVNWYPTARVRFMANYVAADIDDGPFGDGDSEVVQLRAQIDW